MRPMRRQHHAVADRKVGHAGAEFDHLAGRLMTQHRRQLHGQGAFDRLQIRVAQAGGADAHQHVAGSDRSDLQTVSMVIGVAVCRSTAARASA